MGGVEVTDGITVGGVSGLPPDKTGGGAGEDMGDEFGLLLLELVVVMVLVMAGAVVETILVGGVEDMTKLRGDDDLAISSCGSGSLSMAAKLLGISCGDACLFKCTSSLSFSVKPWLQMLQ